jgi:hypothetical protein
MATKKCGDATARRSAPIRASSKRPPKSGNPTRSGEVFGKKRKPKLGKT